MRGGAIARAVLQRRENAARPSHLIGPMRVERVPIRPIYRVGSSGKRKKTLSVYCPFRARSAAAEDCRACPRCVTGTDELGGHAAAIVCASDGTPTFARVDAPHKAPRPSHGRFDEIAMQTPIGMVMAPFLVALDHDVPLDAARGELTGRTGRVLPVVAYDGRLLGIVRADHLVPPPPAFESRRDVRELLSLLAPSTVREVMSAHVVAFPESGRVADALDAMITERVRYLPIVTSDGTVIGIVWDVDILSWLARTRRSADGGVP